MENKKWYVIYTKSRAEKKVYQELLKNEIEAFLPMHKTLRQWSDRRKMVEVPLFNSYIFVRISENESNTVLQTTGVVCFIRFQKEKASIPEQEIQNLKLIVAGNYIVNLVNEKFERGDYVSVDRGPLKDLQGYLINYHGKHKVLIRVDVLDQNLLLEIPVAFLKKVYKKSA